MKLVTLSERWDWLSGQSVCSRFDANPGLRPLIWTILIFLLSFIGLGLIVFPYIIPVQISIYKSAAAQCAGFMLVFYWLFSQLCWLTKFINTWFFGARLPAVNMGSDNFSG
jgi:cytochrome bd-type quinol oxidase subunit 2